MSFIDIRLPIDIERGAVGGPSFKTSVVRMGNATEQRNIDWDESYASWDVGYGVQSKADYYPVLNHFMVVKGRGHTFRFRDHSDFEGIGELLAIGTASPALLSVQLVRVYTVIDDASVAHSHIRVITRPVASTVHIFYDGVEHFGFTVGALGVVTLGTPPGAGVEVTANFEFDVPVRFDTDEFPLTIGALASGEVTTLRILEVRE